VSVFRLLLKFSLLVKALLLQLYHCDVSGIHALPFLLNSNSNIIILVVVVIMIWSVVSVGS